MIDIFVFVMLQCFCDVSMLNVEIKHIINPLGPGLHLAYIHRR